MSLRAKPKKDANDLGAARFGKKTPGAYENVDPFIRFRQRQNYRASQNTASAKSPIPCIDLGKEEADWRNDAWVADRGGLTGGATSVLDEITNEPKGESEPFDISWPAPTISIMNQCRVSAPKPVDTTTANGKKDVLVDKIISRTAKSASKIVDADTAPLVPPSVSTTKSAPKAISADTTSVFPPSKPAETSDVFSAEAVERKMKSLLNKLTERTLESTSNHVLQYVNRSLQEQNGETMKLVVNFICDKAVEDHFWARLYAQLCEKLWKGIDAGVYISSTEDLLHGLEGADLFRHCLLKHCQREFLDGLEQRTEGGSSDETAAANQGSAAPSTNENKAEVASGAEVVFSDEYYAKEAVKRKAKGLIKFMGGLYNVAMLGTSAILQVFTLLMDKGSDGAEEFEIKLACGLLTTISAELLRREAKLLRRDKIEGIVNQLKVINSDRRTSIRTSCYLQASIELFDVPQSGTKVKTDVAKTGSPVSSAIKPETPLAIGIKREITFTDLQVEPQPIILGKQVVSEPVSTLAASTALSTQDQSSTSLSTSPPQPSSPVQKVLAVVECDIIEPVPEPLPAPPLELNRNMLSDIKWVLATTKADQAKQCGQQLIEKINDCNSGKAGQALESVLLYVFENVKATGCTYLETAGKQMPGSHDNATQAAVMIKVIWSHARSHMQLEGFTSSNGTQVKGAKLCKELVGKMMRDELTMVWEDCGMRGDQPRTSIKVNGRVSLDFAVKLFIEDQLPPKIIYECLRRLLNNVNTPLESDVDQLCDILVRTGAKLNKLNSSALAVYVTRFGLLRRSSISQGAKTRVESVVAFTESGCKRLSY
ncbi:hypothetical protein QFC21_006146 [Naganishia friedmannii]|uniref:Uncharacterized protein n=1 Tax=Naganishia friedmannii TaxID=89922 RepID=A0ACC2V3W4_9TREE|nr:hypothetical protein QFC21_006146 [Naganishia friedmannii]